MEDIDRQWRCSCGGSHFLSIRYLDYGRDSSGYLSLESAYRPVGFWDRLKTAWQVLMHGICTLDEIIMDSDRIIQDIADSVQEAGKRLRAPFESLPSADDAWADRADIAQGTVH